MLEQVKRISLLGFLAVAFLAGSLNVANSQTRVSIGVTETIETHDPYGDSVSLLYGIFSEITGPFCTYNYTKGDSKAGSRKSGKPKTRPLGFSI